MLYPNGQRALTSLARPVSGALVQCGAMGYGGLKGARLNRYVTDTTSKIIGGIPSGYGLQSTSLPLQSGAVSARTAAVYTAAGSGLMGLPGEGSASVAITVADAQAFPIDDTPQAATATSSITFTVADAQAYPIDDAPQAPTAAASFSFTVADAEGQLISSGTGSASMTFTVGDALLIASLGGEGSTSFDITTNTPTLGAIASVEGTTTFAFTLAPAQAYPLNDASPLREATANFSITGSMTPYAVGSMSGSTVDNSVLTSTAIAAAVWDSVAAQFTDSSSMGGKLNTASAGGVDLTALATAVRTELAVELARLDVRVGTRASQADVFAA